MGKRVLISGASIAGPALAYWLARYGYDVTVVERAPGIRPGGQAVDFRGHVHLSVLEKMGLLDEIRAHQTGNGPLYMLDEQGNPMVTLPASFTGGEVEILRGDLAGLLYERTRDDVRYRFEDSIASLTETADAVHVTFERGAPETFDLVVGADGLHSNVRRLVFGPEQRFVRDSGHHVAIFEAPNRLALREDVLLYSEPGRGLALYPIRQSAAANVMCVFAADKVTVGRHDIQGQKRLVAQAYDGMGWSSGQVLADLWEARYFYFDSISVVKMDHWTRGRVALLGDAGYGATCGGMGTGLAIVCAYVLAGELAASADHQTAFTNYEQQIKKFTKACQQVAGGVGSFFAPKSIRRRTLLYKALTTGPMLGILDKLSTKAATAITLKDYPTPTLTPAPVSAHPWSNRSTPRDDGTHHRRPPTGTSR
ncbi:FAD-dependent monooxygenase [Actinomadura rupiterrae]|uniref:FAD-dependent monooxygenase n=1 Tax=Actinomadura rupiterrae TaxID=559627 RepID=UPI0020A55F9B|nr:FAD-dependent monooxygenase [Actinomadura rupiterrae]MCP2335213.1 2-polyprenyl-6-methoxyphenol hydroxylase-like FAD-dependent oxidoreductase [Actinomadura rupiterrae]